MIRFLSCILLFFFLFHVNSFGQCPNIANNACTSNAPTVIGNSVTCTPPINQGGRRNFRVDNMIAGATYRISNCGSGYDTQMTIRDLGGTFLDFNDDNGPACTGLASSIDFVPPANGSYRIQLNRYDCATTNNLNGDIIVTLLSNPITNDECGGAILLTSDSSCMPTEATNLGSSSSLIGCAGYADSDVWFQFNATTTTQTITVDPITLYDPVFEVFDGSCGGLTSIACVDNSTSSAEQISLSGLTVDNTYYVRVYNWWGNGFSEEGTFNICVTEPCNPGSITSTTLPGCPSITSGGLGLNGADPAPRNCSDTSCVTLEAEYLDLGEATDYTIEHIAYNPPYQFDNLTNPVSVNVDDVWSPIVNLPFNFCFYGNSYNQCVIGSNGVLSFDTTDSDGDFCEWEIDDNLPNTNLFLNTIFGTYHDIDPSLGGEVGWELVNLPTGCRALVAAWHDVPMWDNGNFGDGSKLYTGMIVLYENTNVIDVYVEEKVIDDTSWNDGNAIIGIQNNNGTQAVVSPCRNGLDQNWTTTNEAWRFIPSGNSVTSITWYEGSGTSGLIIGTGDTICVDPTSTTTYTAEVAYTLCNGTITETDETTVNVNGYKTWNGSISTDWNIDANWTPNGAPTDSDCVLIPDIALSNNNEAIISDVVDGDALNLLVEDNGVLEINTNGSLTVVDMITVETNGTFEIMNSGSLIQVNEVANSGEILVNRNALIRQTDYVYWSTPVDNFDVSDISPATPSGYIWQWTPTAVRPPGPPPDNVPNDYGEWINASGAMVNAKGYIVRGPNGHPSTPTNFSVVFDGVPNNGNITQTITSGTWDGVDYTYSPYGNDVLTVTRHDDNWNLVGNPYPSAIDAEVFLTTNTNIEGAVHIWTHGTALSQANGDPFYDDYTYNYNSTDYITYNKLGTNTYDQTFNGLIASCQGFFIKANHGVVGETVTFNNTMRDRNHINNNFYRFSQTSASSNNTSDNEKHRIWLNLTSPNEDEKIDILVGYIEGATYEKDRLYDAYNRQVTSMGFYSLAGIGNDLIIQGRPLPFDENDQVPLGVIISQNGIHSIGINGVDGLFLDEEQNIYLEDTYLNTIHNLKISPYTFTANNLGTFDDRFILRYTDETLSLDDISNTPDLTIIAPKGKYIKVTSNKTNIKSIMVYDLLGRVLIKKTNLETSEYIMENNFSDGPYLVKATLNNNRQKTQKVILKQ